MKTMKLSSQLLAAALIVLAVPSCTENKTDEVIQPDSPKDVMSYVTTADNTMHFDVVSRDFVPDLNMNPEKTLYLRPSTRYQQIDGFGAAITGASAYNLMRMDAAQRAGLLKETFDPDSGMGYSYVRVPIGASDFCARSNYDYTCCDEAGIEHFALQSDERDYIIPVLKEIMAIQPDLKVMGTPWTCPRWMKVADPETKVPYNSWVGGYLNPDYYADYATYFVKWVQAFEEAGVPIASVTVENEPLNWGNSVSLYMPWQQQRDFVKSALGPAFRQAGLQTKIICFDHNYNYDGKADQQQYPLHIYADAEASQYIDGAAYHNYGGSADELDNIHRQAPDKNLYFTEASIGTWNYQSFGQSLIQEMRGIGMGTVSRWCKSVIVWNFMLDDQGGPHGGSGACTTCYGCVDISSRDYKTLTKRSHYYVIGHLSKAMKPGSTRIGTDGYMPSGVSALAADNPDGTYGLVLMNEQDTAQKMVIDDGNRHFDITLPGKSITTCVWKRQ